MNKKSIIICLALGAAILLAMDSCVTPVIPKLNADDSRPILVVEGQITDQEGPFKVKLTWTSPVSDADNPLPVDNADVKIIDDQGHSYDLSIRGRGIYRTLESNLKGIPGNRYTLIITTMDDGLQYTSTPVLMQQVPDIDSVYFEQVKHSWITKEGLPQEENWVNILIDAHDPSGITKYWRWEYEETYGVYVGPNLTCWVTDVPSASIIVTSTTEKPADELTGFIVRSIGPYNPQLRVRYSILVKQYSIDADLYNYLIKLRDFNETPGGIYSKIPIPLYGNITCCNNTRKALGYFTASSLKEKRLLIRKSDGYLMETIQIPPEVCTSWVAPPFMDWPLMVSHSRINLLSDPDLRISPIFLQP